MHSTLFQKNDVQLPFCIDTRYFKWIEEGIQKQKYEQRWVVLTEEVNTFVEGLAVNHEELALTNVSREDKGPLTVVTATYGDNGLTDEEALELDGEISWWTVSSGVRTFHVKKWVINTPGEIKHFCETCMSSYGYEPEQVSVSCNPTAGEPKVLCEATFTEDIEDDPENDPTTEWGDDDEEEDKKETTGLNCSSTIDTITPSAAFYLERKMNTGVGEAVEIVKIVNGLEAGELVYREAGSLGGRITMSGWYSTDDTNPNALDNPVYVDGGTTTKANVDKARVYLKNIPDVMVPSIRLTVTSKVTSKNKLTAAAMVSSFTTVGTLGDEIVIGDGSKIPAPAISEGWDAEGVTYPISKVQWLDEGQSFDGSSVKKRSSLTTGKTFYEGTTTENYRSVATLGTATCEDGTSSQSI